MDPIARAVREYLLENYDPAIYNIDEATEAMSIYIRESYIPDVVDMFLQDNCRD